VLAIRPAWRSLSYRISYIWITRISCAYKETFDRAYQSQHVFQDKSISHWGLRLDNNCTYLLIVDVDEVSKCYYLHIWIVHYLYI
jgi:hypothetical protein